jgi:hypothetical protein
MMVNLAACWDKFQNSPHYAAGRGAAEPDPAAIQPPLEEKLRKNPLDGVIPELRNLAEKQYQRCFSLLNECRNSLAEGQETKLKNKVKKYMMLVNFSNKIRELNSGYAEHVPEVEAWVRPLSWNEFVAIFQRARQNGLLKKLPGATWRRECMIVNLAACWDKFQNSPHYAAGRRPFASPAAMPVPSFGPPASDPVVSRSLGSNFDLTEVDAPAAPGPSDTAANPLDLDLDLDLFDPRLSGLDLFGLDLFAPSPLGFDLDSTRVDAPAAPGSSNTGFDNSSEFDALF